MCGIGSKLPTAAQPAKEITFKGSTIEVGKDATVITDHDANTTEIDFKEGDTITASPPKATGKAPAEVTLEMEPIDFYRNSKTGYSIDVDHNGKNGIEIEDSEGNTATLPKGATVTNVDTNEGTVSYTTPNGNTGYVFLKPEVITPEK